MIKEVQLRNFKRFKDHVFSFRPSGVTLLAGGNNSGKSSVLQALALWQFCRDVVRARRGRTALEGPYAGKGVPVNALNFSPLCIPSFEHLWTNLDTRKSRNAESSNTGYTLSIGCKWDEPNESGEDVERKLAFGLTLSHERLYIKPIDSTVPQGGRVPRCAYMPPFAGISEREERLSRGSQRRLIGRGLAGAALRNILFDLHQDFKESLEQELHGRSRLRGQERREFYRNEPWQQLCEVLKELFKCELRVQAFNDEYSSAVNVLFIRGFLQNGRLVRFPGFRPRDVMAEGSGFLQWLSVYALAVRSDVDVLLLDEPDAHMHPSLQAHLLDRLRSLARENNKQVLMATHSTEILKRVEPSVIFHLGDRSNQYLSTESQRVCLFEGIGSDYCPKLDQLRLNKRVLFHEGPSDEQLLRIVSERMQRPLPQNLVFWQYGGSHSQRAILFDQLSTEIQGLRGFSLRDRDSLELRDVDSNLIERGQLSLRGELRCRTWRRRHFENYLLVPTAIARASGRELHEVEAFLNTVWGIPSGELSDFVASNCSPGLKDARGKEALYEGIQASGTDSRKLSVKEQFGCTRQDIARNLNESEIAEDLVTFIREVHSLGAT